MGWNKCFLKIFVFILAFLLLLGQIPFFQTVTFAASRDPDEESTQNILFLQWKSKKSSIRAGKKFTFRVTVTGMENPDITWSVSDKEVASISKKGVFLAKRKGKVTVTASVADLSVKQKVSVKGKKKIAIDAGHQLRADSSLEPIGPGAGTKKPKVAGGCTGVSTRVPEYKFTLNMAKKLKKELINRGYDVYMVRTKNAVNISNKERAVRASNSGSDIYIRIHGDSSASKSVTGASGLYPSRSNPYVGNLSAKSLKLTRALMNAYCSKTGIKNRGCVIRNDLTGTNWSKIPVTLIECGFMSNPAEDRKLQDASFQKTMAKGMADGIDQYFGY